MKKLLDKIFKLRENHTDIRTEIFGGLTTFFTMSYIIFVQPALLSKCGMDFGAVMAATCIASAVAIILMAFLANYPIALAPAMGHNVFFVFIICLGMGVPWQTALGINFISGAIFVIFAFFGLRAKIINAIPQSLRNAIAVGIGLLIAFIGFQWAGLVKYSPGTIVSLGDIKSKVAVVSIIGTLITAILWARGKKAAIFIGIVVSCFVGIVFGIVQFKGIFAKVPSLMPTFLKLDILSAFRWEYLGVIFVLFFLDLFDTVGTLIGVSEEAGFIKDGYLPRAKQAFLADAGGTITGTLLGTSTVTSYIESSSGVAAGARTGLANIVTAILFLLSLFLLPVVDMIGGGYKVGSTVFYPVIAPALIIVGCIMIKLVKKIDWQDATEAIPAFVTMMVMPFSFSITEGIAFGFITYSVLKVFTGRAKQVHWLIYLFTILFIARYILL